MKLVCLNAWGGHELDPLLEFIKTHAPYTDLFCFQEVFNNSAGKVSDGEFRLNLLDELKQALPSFEPYYIPGQVGFAIDRSPVPYDLSFGSAIFAQTSLKPEFSHVVLLENNDSSDHPYHETKHLLNVKPALSGKPLTISTLHGLWVPNIGKTDTEERLIQSRRIREFLDAQPGEKILCGDLNLNPGTESLRMLEQGYRNLIADFDIQTTRSALYKRSDRFADYTLVTPGVQVRSFEVPDVPISDHLPMILEFDLAT
ncbi:MAG: endonuclease/exonuclease/phosphatase family protein [Patescibacteria group bacterium]